MTQQNTIQLADDHFPAIPLQPNKTHQSLSLETYQLHDSDETEEAQSLSSKSQPSSEEKAALHGLCSSATVLDHVITKEAVIISTHDEALSEDINGRERLKRHRIEMAGKVWIPDIWGQEQFLKDWADCSAFDASLVPNGIVSARSALVQEGRRTNSGGLRTENSRHSLYGESAQPF